MYLRRREKGWMVVLAEVDDLVITGTDSAGFDELRHSFVDQWKVKDWEPINSFLGINMSYDRNAGVFTMDCKGKVDAERGFRGSVICGQRFEKRASRGGRASGRCSATRGGNER